MRSRAMIFLITLMISACASKPAPAPEVVQVFIPEKNYSGKPKRVDILTCGDDAQERIFLHLKKRDQYIEKLITVIKVHNGTEK